MDLCIICHKPTNNINENGDANASTSATSKKVLKIFFQLLRRYLHLSHVDKDDAGKMELITIQQVIDAGMIPCAACSKLITSFCELYHKLKSIQVLLNWKVENFKNLMTRGHQGRFKITDFQKSVGRLGLKNLKATELISFRNGLIRKCERRIAISSPRVKLNRRLPDTRKVKISNKPIKVSQLDLVMKAIRAQIEPKYTSSLGDQKGKYQVPHKKGKQLENDFDEIDLEDGNSSDHCNDQYDSNNPEPIEWEEPLSGNDDEVPIEQIQFRKVTLTDKSISELDDDIDDLCLNDPLRESSKKDLKSEQLSESLAQVARDHVSEPDNVVLKSSPPLGNSAPRRKIIRLRISSTIKKNSKSKDKDDTRNSPQKQVEETLKGHNSGTKRDRAKFTAQQLSYLEKEFQLTNYIPVTKAEKIGYALNLSEERVKIWFQNRRARLIRESKGKSKSVSIPSCHQRNPAGLRHPCMNVGCDKVFLVKSFLEKHAPECPHLFKN